jgi:hypothetical protein
MPHTGTHHAKSESSSRSDHFRPLHKEDEEKINRILVDYLRRLAVAAQSERWKEHAIVSLAVIRWMRRVPIYYLRAFDDHVIGAARRHGLEHVLSIFIELGWRLLRHGDRESIRHFVKMRETYEELKRLRTGQAIVVIRSTAYSYRTYSENVGWVLSRLLYSDFGVKQTTLGYRPEQFLRIIALLSSCKNASDRQRSRPATERATTVRERLKAFSPCVLLAKQIDSKLGKSANDELMSGVADLGTIGFRAGSACVSSLIEDRADTQLVERFENYTSCMASSDNQEVNRVSWAADGFSFDASGNINLDDGGPHLVNDRSRAEIRIDPRTGESESFSIEDKDYETNDSTGAVVRVNVYEESQFDPATGQLKPGDKITTWSNGTKGKVVEHANGSADWQFGDNQGNSSCGHMNPNATLGNTSNTSNLGGGVSQTTDVSRDGNGNTAGTTISVKTDNGDGTTTKETFTYDAHGNEVSTTTTTAPSDSASTPLDDLPPNPCSKYLYDDPRDQRIENGATKLEQLIIPAPDAVEPSDDPCLTSFGSGSVQKCTSVWLCIEGTVDEKCRCVSSNRTGPTPPQGAATCSKIMCADGATCDPQTGNCRTGDNGWEPGFVVPSPPTSIGGIVPGLGFSILSAVLPLNTAAVEQLMKPARQTRGPA